MLMHGGTITSGRAWTCCGRAARTGSAGSARSRRRPRPRSSAMLRADLEGALVGHRDAALGEVLEEQAHAVDEALAAGLRARAASLRDWSRRNSPGSSRRRTGAWRSAAGPSSSRPPAPARPSRCRKLDVARGTCVFTASKRGSCATPRRRSAGRSGRRRPAHRPASPAAPHARPQVGHLLRM